MYIFKHNWKIAILSISREILIIWMPQDAKDSVYISLPSIHLFHIWLEMKLNDFLFKKITADSTYLQLRQA